jgi:hypothetical protein
MTEGQIIQDFSRQVIMDSTVDLSNVPGFCDLCRVYGSVATIKKSIKKNFYQKITENYRTRESNTQTTTSARRN